jgi:hypothetical protein
MVDLFNKTNWIFSDWDSNPATTFAGLYNFILLKKR